MLSPQQKQVQAIIGALKYPEPVLPQISLPLHRLSCVMSYPPPEAMAVALCVLELAYEHRHVGVTYGGVLQEVNPRLSVKVHAHVDLSAPAPAELEAMADATWGTPADVYALALTENGGVVYHRVRRFNTIGESSMAREGEATSRAGEVVEHAREIKRAMRRFPQRPTVVGTDSMSNRAVGMKAGGAAGRSKHCLRRWTIIRQRVLAGVCHLVHVPGVEMVVDFLTKWVGKEKYEASWRYLVNYRNRVEPPEH